MQNIAIRIINDVSLVDVIRIINDVSLVDAITSHDVALHLLKLSSILIREMIRFLVFLDLLKALNSIVRLLAVHLLIN